MGRTKHKSRSQQSEKNGRDAVLQILGSTGAARGKGSEIFQEGALYVGRACRWGMGRIGRIGPMGERGGLRSGERIQPLEEVQPLQFPREICEFERNRLWGELIQRVNNQ
jgi:hypothetical protein